MSSPAWRLLDGQALRHRAWDGKCVLYNDLSGDTHVLDAGSMRVLLALRAGSLDEPSLAAHYASPDGGAPAAPLAGVLEDLAGLALIARVPC